MTTLFIERWKSNKKGREDHYYLDKGKKQYLLGVNADLVKKDDVQKMLKMVLKSINK